MGKIHTVEQGEHLSAIAARHGLSHYEQVWDDSENAELKAKRADPHQLVPGDRLSIPSAQPVKYRRQTGAIHTFVVKVEKLKLRCKVLDLAGAPLAGVAARLSAGTTLEEVSTDRDGVTDVRIQRESREGALELEGVRCELEIGALAPVDTPTGRAARLKNLGYWYGADDDLSDPEMLELAVELFQNDHELEPTGVMSDEIVAKLAQSHDGKS